MTVLCFVECCSVLTYRATVNLRAVTQTEWSVVQCWNERKKIWYYNSLMDENRCLYTSCDAVSCDPALLPVDMNTTTTVVFTSTQTHDHNKLLAHLNGGLFPSISFCPILKPVTVLLSELHWGKLEMLDLYFDNDCLLQYCWKQHGLTPTRCDEQPYVCAVCRECVVEHCNCNCKLITFYRDTETHELTSESPVDSLDSPQVQTAASLLNPAGHSRSAPALSDGRGWTSKLRPEKHS